MRNLPTDSHRAVVWSEGPEGSGLENTMTASGARARGNCQSHWHFFLISGFTLVKWVSHVNSNRSANDDATPLEVDLGLGDRGDNRKPALLRGSGQSNGAA